jgi:hypothetical protein
MQELHCNMQQRANATAFYEAIVRLPSGSTVMRLRALEQIISYLDAGFRLSLSHLVG